MFRSVNLKKMFNFGQIIFFISSKSHKREAINSWPQLEIFGKRGLGATHPEITSYYRIVSPYVHAPTTLTHIALYLVANKLLKISLFALLQL